MFLRGGMNPIQALRQTIIRSGDTTTAFRLRPLMAHFWQKKVRL